jgi:hypothetical protein
MSVRTFRVIVRGEFHDLRPAPRERLLAEVDQHDLLLARYSSTGDLAYDASLRPFTIRCQVVQPADRADAEAINTGLLIALRLLEEAGLAHRHLRATATCLEDVKINRPRHGGGPHAGSTELKRHPQA